MLRVTYHVGEGFTSEGSPIDGDTALKYRHAAMLQAASLFGGFTAHGTDGGWADPQGNLITEPSWQLSVYTADTEHASAFGQFLRDLFRQTSVYMAVDSVVLTELDANGSVRLSASA